MGRKAGWALGALLLMGGAVQAQAPEELVVYTTVSPGLVERDPRSNALSGPGVAVVRLLFERAGVRYRMLEAPLQRGLVEAARKPNHCYSVVVRDGKNDSRYAWIGPMTRTRLVVMARSEMAVPLKGPQDLEGQLVVSIRGGAPDQWLADNKLHRVQVGGHQNALRMMQRGHADYWVVNELLAAKAMQQEGGPTLVPVYVIRPAEASMACHPSLAEATQERLQKALAALVSEGAFTFVGLGR